MGSSAQGTIPRRMGEADGPARWLVVRGGALGDFLLTLPAIQAVRARAGWLELIANPRYAALVPGLANRITDVGGMEAMWLHGAGPPPRSYHAALVYSSSVARVLTPLSLDPLLEGTPRPSPGQAATEVLWAPLAPTFGPLPPDVRLHADPAHLAALQGRLGGVRPLILAPGAASQGKIWPGFPDLHEALVRKGVPVFWVPGRDEAPPFPTPGPCLDGLDLPDLVALATLARAWVGNDTGTSHLAAMSGCPTLVLFGPTDPAMWCPAEAAPLPFETSPGFLADFLEDQGSRSSSVTPRHLHT